MKRDTAPQSTMYSCSKILNHLAPLRASLHGRTVPPIHVKFMPMLNCTHRCRFCTCGHGPPISNGRPWPNAALMTRGSLPREVMWRCLAEWEEMGVKALELTGGGEPLLYPHIDDMLRRLRASPMEVGLVTNGTALTEAIADALAGFLWARVSIDAGTPTTYGLIHGVGAESWEAAWNAVRLLAVRREHSDAVVGVSYVVDALNHREVGLAAEKAKECGANNIRYTVVAAPAAAARLREHEFIDAVRLVSAARDALADDRFEVVDLLGARRAGLYVQSQDYDLCATRRITCVVGGDGNAYSCCTLAFTPAGRIGSVLDGSFQELWRSYQQNRGFREHVPRRDCRHPCVHENSNRAACAALAHDHKLMEQPRPPAAAALHANFL